MSTASPRRDAATGTWWFVVDLAPGPKGRRRQAKRRGFATKKAAQEALDGIRVAARKGGYIPPARQRLGEFLVEDWLPAVRNRLDVDTWRSYERNIRVHVEPRIGGVPLQSLDAGMLNRFYAELLESGRAESAGSPRSPELLDRALKLRANGVTLTATAAHLRDEYPQEAAKITKDAVAAMLRRLSAPRPTVTPGLKPRTVRYIHTIIHAALKDAMRWSRVPMNAADRADPPSAKASKAPEMMAWTHDQLGDFLEMMQGDRYRFPLLFLATTGCRRGEALGLRWSDVDLDRAVVSIRQQLTQSGFKPRTKSDKPRVIELDTATVAELRRWRADQARERLLLGEGYHDEGLVFCFANGRPYSPERFSREFDRRLSRPPFRDAVPRIRLHDLRHTWATLALVAGVDVKIVSERLGHSSPMITWQTYQHVIVGMQTDAAERVASLIFKRPAKPG